MKKIVSVTSCELLSSMICMLVRCISVVLYFFFSSRRRHTRFDCDWSSDVCSSDLTLLKYFGEEFPASCNGCDNCLEPREMFDGTVPAQKLLSCIQRVRQKSGFSFGLNHIVDVLNGADTEPIRQRGHDQLSTYGIGQDLKRGAWLAIGREWLRLGLVTAAPGRFATLELTEAGWAALRERRQIAFTKPCE